MYSLPYTSNNFDLINFLDQDAAVGARHIHGAQIAHLFNEDSMSGKHRLFYSTRCRHCQAFMAELSKTPFAPEFILVCVDPSPSRPPLPPWLKSVPTMIPAGSSEPLVGPGAVNNWLFARKMGVSGERKSGSEALDERNALIRPPEYTPDLAPRPHATARSAVPPTAAHITAAGGAGAASASSGSSSGKPDLLGVKAYEGTDANVLAYHGNEMSGSGKWSDSYSFLGSAGDSSDKMFNPIGRQFESLVGGLGVPGAGVSGPAGMSGGAGGGPKRSAKEDAEQRRLEAFMAARDKDIPGPPTRR